MTIVFLPVTAFVLKRSYACLSGFCLSCCGNENIKRSPIVFVRSLLAISFGKLVIQEGVIFTTVMKGKVQLYYYFEFFYLLLSNRILMCIKSSIYKDFFQRFYVEIKTLSFFG